MHFGRLSVLALSLGLAAASSAQGIYTPSPYRKFSDGPLSFVDFSGGYSHLENFEDGALNASGVIGNGGAVLSPGRQTDSVDEDDLSLDGFGSAGHSFYVSGNKVEFTFDKSVLGWLPTHAGLAWTDVGFSDLGLGFDEVTFEAFDEAGVLIGTSGWTLVGDGNTTGETVEDLFFGANHAAGIAKISLTSKFSTDWEVDHLQYGYQPVPEPASLAVLTLGALGLLRRRKKS